MHNNHDRACQKLDRGLPLFTWCEFQGLFFKNKHYYPVLLNWLILTMKNNQWQVAFRQNCEVAVFVLQHCWIKNILTNSVFLLFLERKKESFAHSKIFSDHDLNSRTFQGLEIFFPNSRTFQDFQGPRQPFRHIN